MSDVTLDAEKISGTIFALMVGWNGIILLLLYMLQCNALLSIQSCQKWHRLWHGYQSQYKIYWDDNNSWFFQAFSHLKFLRIIQESSCSSQFGEDVSLSPEWYLFNTQKIYFSFSCLPYAWLQAGKYIFI